MSFDDRMDHCVPSFVGDAFFLIVINPEARVTITALRRLCRTVRPNESVTMTAIVQNQGFVTGPLRMWLEPSDAPIQVMLEGAELTGLPDQHVKIHLVVAEPTVIAVEIHVRAASMTGDLGGRDRVQMLIRCEAPQVNASASSAKMSRPN